jgi:hypothetical protein
MMILSPIPGLVFIITIVLAAVFAYIARFFSSRT